MTVDFDPNKWSLEVLRWSKAEARDAGIVKEPFDIYRWRADMERAFGLPKSLWQYMYPAKRKVSTAEIIAAVGEPRLDPNNNRVIRVPRKPAKPSEWQRFRIAFTPSRPTPNDVGGCLVSLAFIVGAFIIGRCS